MPYIIMTDEELLQGLSSYEKDSDNFKYGALAAALSQVQKERGYKLLSTGFVPYGMDHSATPVTFVFEYEESRKARVIV